MSTPDGLGRIDKPKHPDRSAAPDRQGRAINRHAAGRESGEVTTATVIMFPIVLLMIFAIVQTAVAWYAKSALEAAAEDGLRAAQTISIDQAAQAAATSVQTNAGFVDDLTTEAIPSDTGQLVVTVTGKVPGPFPGSQLRLRASATGSLEIFRPQGN